MPVVFDGASFCMRVILAGIKSCIRLKFMIGM
jgi:hypothetical protein